MKPSILFMGTRPRTKGRRLLRHLDDMSVEKAMNKADDQKHQAKFQSRWRSKALAGGVK